MKHSPKGNNKTTPVPKKERQRRRGIPGPGCLSAAELLAYWLMLGAPEVAFCLLQRTAHEDRCVIALPAGTHQKHHVLAALDLRLQLAEIVFPVDRLAVDLEDHVAS